MIAEGSRAEQRETYIQWASENLSLEGGGEDLYALVPGSEVWQGIGEKRYKVEIDETGNYASHCECPHHQLGRRSCKHMAALDRYLLALES